MNRLYYYDKLSKQWVPFSADNAQTFGGKTAIEFYTDMEQQITEKTKDIESDLSGGLSAKVDDIEMQLAQNANLACIIRQDPSTGIWTLLDDTWHSPKHVISVTQDSAQIRIDYDQSFGKIKSFIAVPDDVLNKTGLQFGGDVGTGFANITIGKPSPICGLVMSNNSNFTVLGGVGFSVNDISYGLQSDPTRRSIKITHEKAITPFAPVKTAIHGETTKYDVVCFNVSDTISEFLLVDKVTRAVVNPALLVDGDIAFYFERPSLMSGVSVNPSTPMPAGNNIWVYGLFEI